MLDPGGDLRLSAAFAPASGTLGCADEPRRPRRCLARRAATAPRRPLLASAPVEVVAEIGRLPMRGDEVMGLVAGTVVALGERRRDMITLRVGGRAWARGELVNVDDQLGVRITELLRPR